MLDTTSARSVIDHAISVGADFAELFVERNQVNSVSTLSSEVQAVQSGIDFGIGVRIVYGSKVLYGYTNKTDADFPLSHFCIIEIFHCVQTGDICFYFLDIYISNSWEQAYWYCWNQVTPPTTTATAAVASQQLSQPGQRQEGITHRDQISRSGKPSL